MRTLDKKKIRNDCCTATLQITEYNPRVTILAGKKKLDRIEKTRSDAAEDGWTSNINLQTLAQLGRSASCDFHHAIGSV